MSRMKVKGQPIEGPFVALLKETSKSPAWRSMSHGARSLYVCLKCRYHSKQHNNGRLYVAQAASNQGNRIKLYLRSLAGSANYNIMVSSS